LKSEILNLRANHAVSSDSYIQDYATLRKIIEYQADRMPIGIFDLSSKNFTTQEINYSQGDIIYMFSDGYSDQFGGPNAKKFRSSKLKELILEIHNLTLKEQKKRLEKAFLDWKGDNPQTDDVLIIGLKLK
jgi:serine phosphatase RsbU (regulator of sigma subunit)